MTPREVAVEARWQEGLAQLCAYAAAHDGTVPHTRLVVEEFPLGRWAARQRERYWAGRLSLEQTVALEMVPGWEWGRTQSDRWAEGLSHLRSYVAEHGHAAVDTVTVHEGFALGAWVARRRAHYRRGALTPARAVALEALPGWTWSRTVDTWAVGLAALGSYVATHGTSRVPLDVVHRCYPLGRWVSARRAQYQRGTLTPERIVALQQLPGWVWDVREDRWAQGLRLLTAYARCTGAPNPDFFYVEEDEDGFTLGAWVNSRRKEHRRGVLSPDRVAALEAIKGWEWTPFDAAWHRMYQHLEQEVGQHGTVAHLTQRSVVDGAHLGRWIMVQRGIHRRGRLTPARTRALEAIPGWDWAPRTSAATAE